MKIRYIILSIIVASGYFIVSSCGVEYKLTNPGADSWLALLSRLGEVTRFSKDRIPRLTARTSRVLGARMTARLLGIAFTRSRSGRNGD